MVCAAASSTDRRAGIATRTATRILSEPSLHRVELAQEPLGDNLRLRRDMVRLAQWELRLGDNEDEVEVDTRPGSAPLE